MREHSLHACTREQAAQAQPSGSSIPLRSSTLLANGLPHTGILALSQSCAISNTSARLIVKSSAVHSPPPRGNECSYPAILLIHACQKLLAYDKGAN